MDNVHLFSAGAGSGKTTSLMREVIDAVRSGTSPERIMAITFTRRAADELITRLREELLKSGDRELQRQALRVADGYIGTIDAICERLLREFAFEAGLSPGISVIPEEDVARIFRLATSQTVESRHAELADAARRLCHDGSGGRYQANPDWQEQVRAIVEQARMNGIPPERLTGFARQSIDGLLQYLGSPVQADVDAALARVLDETITAIARNTGDTTKGTREALEALRGFQARLRAGHELTWSEWGKLFRIDTTKSSRPLLEPLHEAAAAVLRHPRLHEDLRTLIQGVFSCAAEAMRAYEIYKRGYGLMDFVDLEAHLLSILSKQPVRDRLSERLDLLLVDEFQDTNPLQLALFTRLTGLVERSVWVGDQKQAIYGFRGTDPALMDAVVESIPRERIRILEDSWRSVPRLVEFTNTLFSAIFSGWLPTERVLLRARRDEIEDAPRPLALWSAKYVRKEGNRGLMLPLAMEIARILERGDHLIRDRNTDRIRRLRPDDIAILCRTNSQCAAFASVLAEAGLRASVARGELLAQTECILALAGMRLLSDGNDRLALAEIMHNHPSLGEESNWLETLVEDPGHAMERWRGSRPVADLLELRGLVHEMTPAELLEAVIDRLGLVEYCHALPHPTEALANLDELKALCREYLDECRARREGSTLAGLIGWLARIDDPGQPSSTARDAVQVLTYHGAKGLEWPMVILWSLDSGPRDTPFEVKVVEAGHFDPADALAGRALRYWPCPSGGNWKGTPLEAVIAPSPEARYEAERELSERARLLYVGMTRARDYLVLAVRRTNGGLRTQWLDDICHGRVNVEFPQPDTDSAEIMVGEARFPCTVRHLSLDEPANMVSREEAETTWHLPPRAEQQPQHPPWSLTPSSHELPDELRTRVKALTPVTLGEHLQIPSGADFELLGDAIHRFLACDLPAELRPASTRQTAKPDSRRLQIARRLLESWECAGLIEPEALITISDRFSQWCLGQWPGATLHTEWPLLTRIGQRRAQGWADVVIETPDGFVLIDHKSYPGDTTQAVKRAQEYAGQLALYREAIEKAMDKAVIGCYIHYVISGLLVPLDIPGTVTEVGGS